MTTPEMLHQPAVYVAVAAELAATGMLASPLAARRAAATDPASTLEAG